MTWIPMVCAISLRRSVLENFQLQLLQIALQHSSAMNRLKLWHFVAFSHENMLNANVTCCMFLFSFCTHSFVQVSTSQLASSTQRDFFRWLRLPVPITTVELPVLLDASQTAPDAVPQQESTTSISVVLPSDMLAALHKAGPEVSLSYMLWMGLKILLLQPCLIHSWYRHLMHLMNSGFGRMLGV